MKKAYLKLPVAHTQHLTCAQNLHGSGPIWIEQNHTKRCLMEMSDESSETSRLSVMAKWIKIAALENERILIVAVLHDWQ